MLVLVMRAVRKQMYALRSQQQEPRLEQPSTATSMHEDDYGEYMCCNNGLCSSFGIVIYLA